jgi:hypothetical protein
MQILSHYLHTEPESSLSKQMDRPKLKKTRMQNCVEVPISPTINRHCISGGSNQFNVRTNIHHDPLYDDSPITNVAKVTPGTLYQFILHEGSTNLITQAEQLYGVARIQFRGLEIDQLSTECQPSLSPFLGFLLFLLKYIVSLL